MNPKKNILMCSNIKNTKCRKVFWSKTSWLCEICRGECVYWDKYERSRKILPTQQQQQQQHLRESEKQQLNSHRWKNVHRFRSKTINNNLNKCDVNEYGYFEKALSHKIIICVVNEKNDWKFWTVFNTFLTDFTFKVSWSKLLNTIRLSEADWTM
jgi:hypothetical protein